MKALVRIALSSSLALAPALALAQDDPNLFSRTLRSVNAFFGADASAEADLYARSRFTAEEREILRRALHRRAYDDDHDDDDDDEYEDDDHDDDDKARKAKKGKQPKKLPPGLRKKVERGGQLPPGWQKKFERGEVVSAEVWAQSRGLPTDVRGRITAVPGTEVIQVGDRVARVLTETREILDVIDLVTQP